jgi:PAS domain S-box-containing protein
MPARTTAWSSTSTTRVSTLETLDRQTRQSNNRGLTSRQDSFLQPAVEDGVALRIAEQTADGLYIVDHDGNFAFVNPAAVALFGYNDESELLGRNSHATTHYRRPDGSPYPVQECPLLKPRTTGESVRVDEDWFFRRDGSMIPVAYSSAPFPMEGGAGAVVAMRDMTELRRTQDELRLLQTATLRISSAEDFESAVAAVIREVCVEAGWVAGEMWVPNADCTFLELGPGWWAASPEMEEFFVKASAPQTMALGEGLPGMVWRDRRAVWIDVTTTRREGPRIHTARKVGFAAGVAVPVLAGADEVVAVLGFFADHRRVEDERWTNVLSAIAAQLGPVLSRKRAEEELARQAIELARSNADLRLFAELAAHELQQPLHAIVHRLAQGLAGPAGRDELLESALASARRLQDSIDGLLRYATVGEPTRGSVSADEVADQVLADLSLELEEAGADVVRRPLPNVEADATQLRVVFHNLLSNALRYRSSEPLRIEVGSFEDALYVRDNGRGIDPGDHGRVFELFGRGASAGEVDGIGIGLALSRRIVEAHGGELWLESEPATGTTFFFTVRAA